MSTFASHSVCTRLCCALMLVSLLLGRSLAAPGWMPTVVKDQLVVTLCSESGGGNVVIAFDREHPPKKDTRENCTFAASDYGAPPPASLATYQPQSWPLQLAYSAPPIVAGIIASQAPPPPSTGPPLV